MEKIRINLKKIQDDSYDILIGRSMFPLIADGLAQIGIKRVAIITDSTVKRLYGNTFLSYLKDKHINSLLVSVQPGEENKTRYTKEKMEDTLFSSGFDRNSVLVALGGGVVGDLTGYLASTYMRGIPYVQIPTTLLAMVDSSIGGKTGVNTQHGKNMVGTLYQPKRVFIDLGVLRTLPQQDKINGIVEMIKCGIIADEQFLIFINDYYDKFVKMDEPTILKAIQKCCQIKKSIVEEDETEKSRRKILNFGHTRGHAIEQLMKYQIPHGEAIAIGMLAETKIAEEKGLLTSRESQKIVDILRKTGLQIKLGKMGRKKIIEFTKNDKKNADGNVKYVLPRTIGSAVTDVEVEDGLIAKVLGEMK